MTICLKNETYIVASFLWLLGLLGRVLFYLNPELHAYVLVASRWARQRLEFQNRLKCAIHFLTFFVFDDTNGPNMHPAQPQEHYFMRGCGLLRRGAKNQPSVVENLDSIHIYATFVKEVRKCFEILCSFLDLKG